MTYEGLPTAARNVARAVDFKIAVPLGLERGHLRPIAVVEGPGSPTENFWTERDFSTKLKGFEVAAWLAQLKFHKISTLHLHLDGYVY